MSWWEDPKNLEVGTLLKHKRIPEFTYRVATDPAWGPGIHIQNVTTGSWFRLDNDYIEQFELVKP